MLDLAVNIGTDNATLCLQRALRACAKRTEEDGVLGSVTRAAASGANQVALLSALKSEAAGYYRLLATQRASRGKEERFLEGWLNRAYE
jgi:lysozyme family protein